MNPNKNLLEIYEELVELRKRKAQAQKVEDEPTRLLKEFYYLAKSISVGVKDVTTTARTICNETRHIKYHLPSDDCLYLGKESARPLIEFTNTTMEVLANIESMGTLTDTDFEQVQQRLEDEREDLKKITEDMSKYVECVRKLNFIAGVLLDMKDKGLLDESTLPEDTDTYGSFGAHNEASKSDSMEASFEDTIMFGSHPYPEEQEDQFPFKDSLNTAGVPIELKNIVAEMYANIEKDEEEMKSFINKKNHFIKQLIYTEEIIADLQIGRETVRAESTLSATGNVGTNKRTLCTCMSCLKIIKEFS